MSSENELIVWLSETNIQAAIIGPIITSLIGLVAYLYHDNNHKKAALATLIQDIERSSVEHWCSQANDVNNRTRCLNIQHLLKTLSWKINQNCNKKREALIQYRKTITSDDFGEPNRTALEYDAPRVSLISEQARKLRKVLKIKKHH